MKQNMGMLDRTLRVLIAIGIVVFYFTSGSMSLLVGILLGVAGVFALTSLVSFCPLYAIFGINTCPRKTV